MPEDVVRGQRYFVYEGLGADDDLRKQLAKRRSYHFAEGAVGNSEVDE